MDDTAQKRKAALASGLSTGAAAGQSAFASVRNSSPTKLPPKKKRSVDDDNEEDVNKELVDLTTPVKSSAEKHKKAQPQSESPLMSMLTVPTLVAGNLGSSEDATKTAPVAPLERMDQLSDSEIEVVSVHQPPNLTEAKSMSTTSTRDAILHYAILTR